MILHKKLNKIHHGYIRNCFSDNLLGIKKFIKDIHIEDSNTIINLNLHSNVDIKYANQFLNIFKEKLKMVSLISMENNSGLSENFFTDKNSDFCRVIKNKNYSLYLNKKKKEFFYSHYPIKRLTIVNLYIYYNYFRLRNFVKKLILNRY